MILKDVKVEKSGDDLIITFPIELWGDLLAASGWGGGPFNFAEAIGEMIHEKVAELKVEKL